MSRLFDPVVHAADMMTACSAYNGNTGNRRRTLRTLVTTFKLTVRQPLDDTVVTAQESAAVSGTVPQPDMLAQTHALAAHVLLIPLNRC
jgi:hypothetical protein